MYWLENLGGFNYGESSLLFEAQNMRYLFFDADTDGDKDIVYRSVGEPNLLIANTVGDGSVDLVTTSMDPWTVQAFCSGDLDNDGDEDIVIQSTVPDLILWYENLGDQGWSAATNIDTIGTAATLRQAPVLEDFDNDGDLDLIAYTITSASDNISLYENDGQGGFGPEQIVYARFVPDVSPYRFTAADMNLDGTNDIALSVEFFDEILILPGNGDGTFGQPLNAPPLSREIATLDHVDVDKDGDIDLIGDINPFQGLFGLYQIENYLVDPGQARGRIFFDENQNGVFDTPEIGLNFIGVSCEPEAAYSYTDASGRYKVFIDDLDIPSYQVMPEDVAGWSITTDPAFYTIDVDESFTFVDSLDFGFYPDSFFTALDVNLVAGIARCNTAVNYWINIGNQGSNLTSGLVHLQLDDPLDFIESSLPPDSVVGNDVYWHFDSLGYFENLTITSQVQMPGLEELNTLLESTVEVTELNGSEEPAYQTSDEYVHTLVCAYDPNDKSVEPFDPDSLGIIEPDQELTYLIRFQNTGTDTAVSVILHDQLSSLLDYSTFAPVSSSHEMEVSLSSEGLLEFAFYNIMLPDSNVDYSGSQGYAEFRIQPLPGIAPNTQILNTAEIFFDFNPPIVTNTVQNTIICYLAPEPLIIFSYPALLAGDTGVSFQWFLNGEAIEGATSETWIPQENGSYTVAIEDENGCATLSAPFAFNSLNLDRSEANPFNIYPNPSDGIVYFDLSALGGVNAKLQVFDYLGKELYRQVGVMQDLFSLDGESLGSGIFIVRVTDPATGELLLNGKFVVKP